MGAPLLAGRSVEDVAVDLILRADAFRLYRDSADRIAADLERRWEENRAYRAASSAQPDMR